MSRFKKVPVKDLFVDDRYQRPVDETRVKKIADGFNDRLFGTLEVAVRNGKSAVFDGQHRLAAAKLVGREVVPCIVHTDLDPVEEAQLFVELQRRRKGIQPVDRFKARVFSGDVDAVAIDALVQHFGFRVYQGSSSTNGERRQIAAVGSLERVYALGVLAETLELIRDVWGGDPKSTEGWLIDAVGILLDGYGHRIGDDERKSLREIAPTTLLRRAVGRLNGTGDNSTTRRKLIAQEMRKHLGLRVPAVNRQKQASAAA